MSDSTRAPVENWQADGLRISLFRAAVGPPLSKLWAEIVKEEPENTSKARGGITLEQGAIRGGSWQFVTNLTHDRIDLAVSPTLMATNEIAALGSVNEAISIFMKLVADWLPNASSLPPIKRAALGVVARLPVASTEEGYARLNSYVPIKLDGGMSDFLYQINRRRPCTIVEGLKFVNRLSKWSVALTQIVGFSAIAPQVQLVEESQHGCRIELDINTAPEDVLSLDGKNLQILLAEFATMALEIVRDGDIP